MKKLILIACLFLWAGFAVSGQIIAWNFYGLSQPVSCAATFVNVGISASDVNMTRGPGAAPSAGVHSFRTTGFQNNGISTANADYFQITLKTEPGFKVSCANINAKFGGTATFYASPGVTSQFAYSVDGVNFTLIGNPVQSTSLTMATVDLSAIPELQDVYYNTTITIRYYASGQTSTGGWGFYSATASTYGFEVDGIVEAALTVPPSIQASEIAFSNTGQNQTAVSWTPGDGERRIVMINSTNAFTPPANGAYPPANTVYSGSGQQVVYNNSGNTIPAVTGLQPGITYWFRVFEFNGTDNQTLYLTTTATNNPRDVTTSNVFLPPFVVSATSASIATTAAILGGRVSGNGGSAITERGTLWSISSPVTISDHLLAEGGVDTGVFVHQRTDLPAGSKVYFTAYAVNAIGTTLAAESHFFTLAVEPTSHVTNFTAATGGTTTLDLSWTPAISGIGGYLILQKQGEIPSSATPQDAGQYAPGATLADAVVAANVTNGAAGSQVVTGLSPGTEYSFTIFPYHWDGTNAKTTNYFTEPDIPSASATTAIPLATTYYWTGAAGNGWATAASWNPERTVPALNDILIFNQGGTSTIISVPAQTIGQMKVTNNTAVTLQGSGILAISGNSGDDLLVDAGCQLNISGSNVVTISLAATAKGNVSGSMTFSGGGHRFLAADANGITFQSGGSFKAGSGFAGNPFGTVNLNSVVFTSGSTYIAQAGGNPFGAAAPASVVIFQHGSLYRIDAYAVPSLGGRTYGDFEMNYTGIITVTGSAAVSIDNFIASQGTFYFNLTGNPGHSVKGDIFVSGLATLIFSPSAAGSIHLNGISAQTISGSGSIMAGVNSTLVVDNLIGVNLSMDAELNNLTIGSGAVFTIETGASLTVEGDLVNSAAASGFIIESDGSLIHHSSGVQATLERTIAAANWSDWQDGWHFFASPVASQTINAASGFVTSGTGNDYDFYAWSEPENNWINFKNTTVTPTFQSFNGSGNFTTGKGYLAAYQQSGTKLFSGEINVSDVAVNNLGITGNNQNRGWHLLGNPFSSSLTWYADWNPLNIGGVAMIWNETGMSYSPVNAGEPIPPLNGFMVQATGTSVSVGSLVMPASRRIHDDQLWYKTEEVPVIRLFARNLSNGSFQEGQIRFNPYATNGFDPVYDGRFLSGYGPLFYARVEDEYLTVSSLPDLNSQTEIPFDFIKNEGSQFQLEARITGAVPAMVHLLDKKEGKTQNLSLDPIYLFSASPDDNPDRFLVSFSHVGQHENQREEVEIYSYGNMLCVKLNQAGFLEIHSITGLPVMCKELSQTGSECITTGLNSGYYIVKITTGYSVHVKKVFIASR